MVVLLSVALAEAGEREPWFFFVWDALKNEWAVSDRVYTTLAACELGAKYTRTFGPHGFRVTTACIPDIDGARPAPRTPPPSVVVVPGLGVPPR